jgi:hypothetical protein
MEPTELNHHHHDLVFASKCNLCKASSQPHNKSESGTRGKSGLGQSGAAADIQQKTRAVDPPLAPTAPSVLEPNPADGQPRTAAQMGTADGQLKTAAQMVTAAGQLKTAAGMVTAAGQLRTAAQMVTADGQQHNITSADQVTATAALQMTATGPRLAHSGSFSNGYRDEEKISPRVHNKINKIKETLV